MGTSPPPATADWAVIGAGLTGLAAARRLAELHPDQTVLLLDARPVGWGSSGRNAGFVIDLPHKFDLDGGEPERMNRVVRLNTAAISDLDRLVAEHSIDCNWSKAGKLQAAIGETGMAAMKNFSRILDSINQPYKMLDRQAVADISGTRHYQGAIFTPGCILMNPARLVRGLAHSLPGNVVLLDGCPVLRHQRRGDGFELSIRRQGIPITIQVGGIIAGTSAYTPELGWMRRRIVPVATFASITRPLSDAHFRSFGGKLDWGLTPADIGGTTIRMTQDRRLFMRNQYDYVGTYAASDATLDRVRTSHRIALARRWPQLADIPFESTWGGVTALARNRVSYFGEMAPRVWSSNTDNGVGVARGTISGRLLAEMASGIESDLLDDMQAVSAMPVQNPPRPFVGIGVKARLRYEAWRSRKEI
ncbi:FAD-dependent oxidoreductase [Novosphingobium sp. BL-8H]|uniref:NAD(P)/FAD-dependent oxidoreductase n=1 Tax=Novosphingobium sp. BL-8H TaxID=3127640 RepID=UPI003756B49B